MPPKTKSTAPAASSAKASAAAPKKTTTKSKGGPRKQAAPSAPADAGFDRVVLTESLLATDAEKHATSKTLYGDSAARISSNVYNVHDSVRHRAYEALFRSIKGKSLLHLGCGIGLYPMLAARAGARHVVALDTSAVIDPARVVAQQNGLENVTFLRGRLRDVLPQLPEKKFDVVLCEWMGTFLLNEDVLSDVLYARDHLLAENGIICPNKSSIYVVGVSDYNFRLDTEDFWSNVYGFRMEPMKSLVRTEVEMCAIPAENIMTGAHMAYTAEVETIPGLNAAEEKEYESNSLNKEGATSGEEAKGEKKKDSENPVEAKWIPYTAAQKGIDADFTITAARDCSINYLTFFVDAAFTSKVDTGANFVLGIRPGGRNAWTEVSVGLKEALPVKAGERIVGHVSAFTPAEKGGRVTIVRVSAKTEGKVANIATEGEYYYQSY